MSFVNPNGAGCALPGCTMPSTAPNCPTVPGDRLANYPNNPITNPSGFNPAGLGPVTRGDKVTDFYDYIDHLCGDGLNIWTKMCGFTDFASIPNFLFDQGTFFDSGSMKRYLKLKNAPMYSTMSETGYSVFWYEKERKFSVTTASGAVANASVIPVVDASRFFVNDDIMIQKLDSVNAPCCITPERAIITAVDKVNNTITVSGGPYTFDAGTRIVRLYETLKKCETPNQTYDVQPMTKKEAFYQYFGAKLCFTNDEINVCWKLGGPQALVNNRIDETFRELYLNVCHAFWMGRNIGPIGVGGNTNMASQTLGLLTAIYQADYENPALELIHDFSSLNTPDEQVNGILQAVMKAQECTFEGKTKDLYLAVNDKLFFALQSLLRAFNQFSGLCCTTSQELSSSVEFRPLLTLKLPKGVINVVMEHFLTMYYPTVSFGVILPRDLTAVYMRKNRQVTMDGRLEGMVGNWIVQDANVSKSDKIDCDPCYIVWTQLAFIHGFTDSGAYRILMNIKGLC